MARSTKMFVEQSNFAMPPSVWLHVNGVSLTTDLPPYQPPVHTYDYRTKHLQSPVQPPTPPLISPSAIVPCSITMIDGPFSHQNNNNNKQYQKLENTDMPKKFFVDRHIKKAKSLPGLIKGTALSRHTPLQSSTFTSPAPTNPSANAIQDDQLPMITPDNDTDSLVNPPLIDAQTEPRRPRVYFADFNKILFLDDNHEISQQHQTPVHRRHRRRFPKKTSNSNQTKQISPSIQQTQALQNFSRPSNHPMAQELSIKKQRILASPRPHSSRLAHLPDILNQSLPIELTLNEKHSLQREKPLVRPPKPIIEIPNALSTDQSSEDAHQTTTHSLPPVDSQTPTHESECGESPNGLSTHPGSTASQTSINRRRASLRTISLRQQFISSVKAKPTGAPSITNNNHPHQQSNARRASFSKQSNLPLPNEDDDLHANNGISSINENNRSIPSNRSVKQLKRSDVIHFNSKNPFGGNAMPDSTRTHVHESTPSRFQNLLTVVRPPYGNGNGYSPMLTSIKPGDSAIPSIHYHHSMPNYRSTRAASARESFGYHPSSNTIIV